MRILLLAKRRYTNRDLIHDRFGRLFHLPAHWARHARVRIACLDYRATETGVFDLEDMTAVSRSLRAAPFRAVGETLADALAFNPNVVVASSDIIYGLLGARIARRAGAGFVFDLYDDYRCFLHNRISGLALALGPVCRRANLLLCASQPIREAVRRFGTPCLVVPNGYDPEVFRPGRDSAPRKRFGVGDDELLLVYPGAVGSHVDADLVVRALAELNASGPPVRALFVGAGAERLAAQSPHVVASSPVPQAELAGLIRASDVGIAPYRSTGQTEASAPCKLAEFLACGVPVVAAEVSDLASLAAYGVATYPAGNVDAFVGAVRAQSRGGPSRPVPGWTWEELAAASLAAIKGHAA